MLERLTQEQLIEKFNPMLHSITRKYTGVLEFEDLYQECCIAILEAYSKYDPNKAKLETYMYNTINWTCQNLARSNKKHIKTISLQLLANTDHSGDTPVTIQDTLEADVNVADTVEDKLMEIFYRNRIRHALNEEEATAILDKVFYGCIGVDYKLIKKARKNLIRRDAIFREEYFKIKNLKENTLIYE